MLCMQTGIQVNGHSCQGHGRRPQEHGFSQGKCRLNDLLASISLWQRNAAAIRHIHPRTV